jgi:hypothetical protein
MRVPFAGATTQGNFTGKRNGSNPPPGSKVNNNKAKPVRTAKLDMISKLETKAKAEELRTRIRTAKDQGRMMSLQPPVHVAPCANVLQQARTALSTADTIALSKVREQLQAASAETHNILLTGDMNLDTARRLDMRYRRRCPMLAHNIGVAEANMRYLETGITYRSHGRQVCEE